MKKLYFFVVAAAAMLLSACDQAEVQLPDALTLVSYEVVVGQAGVSEMPIAFAASTDWTIASDKTFVSFTPSEGVAGEDVVVKMSVAANDTYADREANVTITAGSISSSFVVKQGFDTEFDAVVTYKLPFEASDFTFTVNTNADYKVVVPEGCDWIWEGSGIQPRTKAAPSSKDIVFFVAENNEDSAREAVITIDAGNIKYGVKVYQENQAILSDMEIRYLGRRMFIYDMDEYMYSEFNQYYVTFKSGEKTVAISLNGAYDPDYGLYSFPTGVFGVDLNGKHSVQTFTVAGIDSEFYTTVIDEKGNEIDIVDGTIDVKDLGGDYSVVVALETAEGTKLNYKFVGELPEEFVDDSFGANLYDGTYRTDYNTYFTNHNKEWSLAFVTSQPAEEYGEYARFIQLSMYADASVPADVNALPAGEYTFDVPESEGTGKVNAKAFSFSGSVSNADDAFDIFGGKIIVSDCEDGKKQFEFAISMASHALDEDGYWVYDEDYNYVYNDPVEYNATFAVALDCEEGLKPTPDGDAVLTNSTMSSKFVGLWFGNPDASVEGFSVMTVNPTYLGGVYNMYLSLGLKDWVWEKNFSNYCNTPIPDGVYEFSQVWKTNSLLPLVFNGSSPYGYVQNTYTGTVCLICDGSVEIKEGKATFNMKGLTYPAQDAVYNFTGTIDFALYYARDYSKYSTRISLLQFSTK